MNSPSSYTKRPKPSSSPARLRNHLIFRHHRLHHQTRCIMQHLAATCLHHPYSAQGCTSTQKLMSFDDRESDILEKSGSLITMVNTQSFHVKTNSNVHPHNITTKGMPVARAYLHHMTPDGCQAFLHHCFSTLKAVTGQFAWQPQLPVGNLETSDPPVAFTFLWDVLCTIWVRAWMMLLCHCIIFLATFLGTDLVLLCQSWYLSCIGNIVDVLTRCHHESGAHKPSVLLVPCYCAVILLVLPSLLPLCIRDWVKFLSLLLLPSDHRHLLWIAGCVNEAVHRFNILSVFSHHNVPRPLAGNSPFSATKRMILICWIHLQVQMTLSFCCSHLMIAAHFCIIVSQCRSQ